MPDQSQFAYPLPVRPLPNRQLSAPLYEMKIAYPVLGARLSNRTTRIKYGGLGVRRLILGIRRLIWRVGRSIWRVRRSTPSRPPDKHNAHMFAYRAYLRSLNLPLAEDYIRQHSHLVSTAIEELAKAVPVAIAFAQLYDAIRRSPARNFWPVIRATKGVLLVRSTGPGQECPWPWKRTKSGNLRYKLPGHLLFSPWRPNILRLGPRSLSGLQRVADEIKALSSEHEYYYNRVSHLPYSIWNQVQLARFAISDIKALQGLAMPDSIAALDTWSNDPQRGSNITLRISQGMLIYNDGSDRCEIEVPDTLTNPLCAPSLPDRRLELHLVRNGDTGGYYP